MCIRDRCLTCGYEQIDRDKEHQHYYTDDWSSGSTTHWKVCYYCKEVNQDVYKRQALLSAYQLQEERE